MDNCVVILSVSVLFGKWNVWIQMKDWVGNSTDHAPRAELMRSCRVWCFGWGQRRFFKSPAWCGCEVQDHFRSNDVSPYIIQIDSSIFYMNNWHGSSLFHRHNQKNRILVVESNRNVVYFAQRGVSLFIIITRCRHLNKQLHPHNPPLSMSYPTY